MSRDFLGVSETTAGCTLLPLFEIWVEHLSVIPLDATMSREDSWVASSMETIVARRYVTDAYQE